MHIKAPAACSLPMSTSFRLTAPGLVLLERDVLSGAAAAEIDAFAQALATADAVPPHALERPIWLSPNQA